MRLFILKNLLFVVLNIILFITHFYIFRSDLPFLWVATVAIHILLLIFFPYKFLNKT